MGKETEGGEAAGVTAAGAARAAVAATRGRRDLAPRGRERLELDQGQTFRLSVLAGQRPRGREWLELGQGHALGPSLVAGAQWSDRTERPVRRWRVAGVAGGVPAGAEAPLLASALVRNWARRPRGGGGPTWWPPGTGGWRVPGGAGAGGGPAATGPGAAGRRGDEVGTRWGRATG